MTSHHLSVVIRRPPDEVYAFAAEPDNLMWWAGGLASAEVHREGDVLVAASPLGPVRIVFVERNAYGVLDHDVTTPDGVTTHNPLRVLAHPEGAEVLFTLRRLAMTDDELARDAGLVRSDLARLREILEGSIARGTNEVTIRLHHVQVACPPGGEDEARRFYADGLGLAEVDKPADLRAKGGAWFRAHDAGGRVTAEVHVGVEEPFVPARKAHPALQLEGVAELETVAARLAGLGFPVDWTQRHSFPGHERCHCADGHGNRVELLAPTGPS